MPEPRPALDELLAMLGGLELPVQLEAATIVRFMPDPTIELTKHLATWLELLGPSQPIRYCTTTNGKRWRIATQCS